MTMRTQLPEPRARAAQVLQVHVDAPRGGTLI
jgi:hypothetical protein